MRARGLGDAAARLVAAWYVSALVGALAAQGGAAEFELARLVGQAEAKQVRTGCVVLEPRSGRVLFERRADESFTPASNEKILTAVAALQGLGQDYEFVTSFRLRQGMLVVEGGGDPNWRTGGEHDPARIFAEVADHLRAGGVAAVRSIQLVAARFSGPDRPAGWPADQLQHYYCAPTGGLVLEAGCFRALVEAGSGDTARIELLAPPVAMTVQGALRLTANRKQGGLYGLREDGGVLVASGHFYRKAGARTVVGAVRDPVLLFRLALQQALAAAGIAVEASASSRDLEPYEYRSPLVTALREMLVESSNFHAEQVLRVLGAETRREGSFAAGALAVREQIGNALVDPPPRSWRIADGSGLDRANRVTPRLLAETLQLAAVRPYAAALRGCLPRPGEGTLDDRFATSPVRDDVRAKTGWIRGASSLSGYVGELIFAITMNYDPDRGGLNRELKSLQESMVEACSGLERS